MVAVAVEVCALADDFGYASSGRSLGEDAAYLGVGRGKTDCLRCEAEGVLHENLIVVSQLDGVRHSSEDNELSGGVQDVDGKSKRGRNGGEGVKLLSCETRTRC